MNPPTTRWIAAGGAFLVSLDSMVNISFPSVSAGFGVPADQVGRVIIYYVFAYSILAFVGGVLGDRFGHVRVFCVGLAGCGIAYTLAGGAVTFGWLLTARVVQGVASGLVHATAAAMVILVAEPGERGRATGFVNAAIGIAYAMGPLLAGELVARFGWRAVFYARIPLAFVVLAWAGLALSPAFGRLERSVVSRADILRGPVLRGGALAFLAYSGMFAIWLLEPFDLVERRGLDARMGGLLFMLTPLGMALGSPLAGRLTDRLGPRTPVLAGLVLEALGLAVLSVFDVRTPEVAVAAALFAAGLGLGVFQVPNMAALMVEFRPAHQGAAGGIVFLARMLGVMAGVATFGAVFRTRRAVGGFDAGFAASFQIAAAVVGVAAALAACAILAAAWRRRQLAGHAAQRPR